MSKDSIIPHPPRNHTVVLREDYVELCEGADDYERADQFCAAMILSQFEYWLNVKLSNREQAEFENTIAEKEGLEPTQNEDLWVWKSIPELKEELMDQYGRKKVMKSLEWLVEEKNYLLRRKNPNYKWDRTYQYMINVDLIIDEIKKLEGYDYEGDLKGGNSTSQSKVPNDTNESGTVGPSRVANGTFNSSKRDSQQSQMGPTIPKTTMHKTTSKDKSASRAKENPGEQRSTPEPPLAPQLKERIEKMLGKSLSNKQLKPFGRYTYGQVKAALDTVKRRGTKIASHKYILKMLKDEINGRNYKNSKEDNSVKKNENPDSFDLPPEKMKENGWNQGINEK